MNLRFLNPPIVSSNRRLRQRAAEALDTLAARDSAPHKFYENRLSGNADVYDKMKLELSPETLIGFQSHVAIAPHVTGGSGRHFLTMIEKEFGQRRLDGYLRNYTETLCGHPKDIAFETNTYISTTAMRHLYHLARMRQTLQDCTNLPVTVVEIGGGYGNLCRLAIQYGLCDKYYIVDHPVLNVIQHFYLTEFISSDKIAVVDDDGRFIKGDEESTVSLYSSFSYQSLNNVSTHPYVLCSTMALTEINDKGQRGYLDFFNPSFIYIFGRLDNPSMTEGVASGADYFGNGPLIEECADKYHTLHYGCYGEHFEYMGRRVRL